MDRFRRFSLAVLGAMALGSTLPCGALAQAFPSRVITIVVPTAPGSSTDPLARVLASQLQIRLKQPVVVLNKVGAGGLIGTEFVVNAPPDGYTLLFTPDAAMHSSLFFKEQRSPLQELTLIKMVATQPLGLLVSSSLDASNLREFIAAVKANPTKYNYGYIVNTTLQLESERIMRATGMEMTGISYNNTASAVQALIAGDIQFVLSGLATMRAAIDAGKGKVVALTSLERFPQLPAVPTGVEQGLQVEYANRSGVFGSSKIPQPVQDFLQKEIAIAIETNEMKELLKKLSLESMPGTLEDHKKLLLTDAQRFAEMARLIGIERK